MSKNAFNFLNRFVTASMLVVSLIACQQMPENNNNTFNFPGDRTWENYRTSDRP
jgi:hypothetical protein